MVMHNPNVIVHFRPCAHPTEWGNVDSQIRPRVVKRGVDDIDDIDFGEYFMKTCFFYLPSSL